MEEIFNLLSRMTNRRQRGFRVLCFDYLSLGYVHDNKYRYTLDNFYWKNAL